MEPKKKSNRGRWIALTAAVLVVAAIVVRQPTDRGPYPE